MIDHELAAEVDELAQRIARMRPPQSSNPAAFHEDRSELASVARAIATRLRGAPPALARSFNGEHTVPVSGTHQVRHENGRTFVVLTRPRRPAGVR